MSVVFETALDATSESLSELCSFRLSPNASLHIIHAKKEGPCLAKTRPDSLPTPCGHSG